MQEGSRIAIFAPAIKDPQVVKVSFSTILYVLLFLIETEKNIDIMRGHRKAKQSYHKQCTPLLSQSRIQLMHQRSCCLECLNHAASVSYYLHLDNHAPAAFSLWRRKPISGYVTNVYIPVTWKNHGLMVIDLASISGCVVQTWQEVFCSPHIVKLDEMDTIIRR